jgi:hypothetical protein
MNFFTFLEFCGMVRFFFFFFCLRKEIPGANVLRFESFYSMLRSIVVDMSKWLSCGFCHIFVPFKVACFCMCWLVMIFNR